MDDALQRFTQAVALGPTAPFAALHTFCDETIGARLFTCSRFDLVAGQAERIYTSDAEAYPLTGLKEIVPNRWTGIVLDERRPFLATGIEELRDVFPDHAKIEALGLGAAINLPVYLGGALLGTVNLLDENGRYSAATLQQAAAMTLCATVAFLAAGAAA